MKVQKRNFPHVHSTICLEGALKQTQKHLEIVYNFVGPEILPKLIRIRPEALDPYALQSLT